jgi:hypothetical protein
VSGRGTGLQRWTLEVVDAELSRRALALAGSMHQEHGRLERAGDDDDGPTVTAHGWPFRVEGERRRGAAGRAVARRGGAPVERREHRLDEEGAAAGVVDALHAARRARGRSASRTCSASPRRSRRSPGLADRVWLGLLLALGVAIVLGVAWRGAAGAGVPRALNRLTAAARSLDTSSTTARLDVSGLDPDLKGLADAFNGALGRLAAAAESATALHRARQSCAAHATRGSPLSGRGRAAHGSARHRTTRLMLDDIAGLGARLGEAGRRLALALAGRRDDARGAHVRST